MNKTRFVISAVAVVIIAIGVFLVDPDCSRFSDVTVRGDSMAGILSHGDVASLHSRYYSCHEPARGDLAMIEYRGNPAPIVKQVRGLPGDHLTFAKDSYATYLILNRQPLTTTRNEFFYVDESAKKLLSLYLDSNANIKGGTYLLLGNQPVGSIDSRDFGLLGKRQFLGRIFKK